MKELNIIIYEKDDYEKLDNMSIEEIINELNNINYRWIPSTRYHGEDDYEGDEDDYRNYKMYKALCLAKKMLREVNRYDRS